MLRDEMKAKKESQRMPKQDYSKLSLKKEVKFPSSVSPKFASSTKSINI
jgi:hypothetical protein